jgi:plastocyanin
MRIPFSVVALFVVMGACSSPSPDPFVQMTGDHFFAPDEVLVEPGTTIVFTNEDDEPHSVTAYENAIPDDATYFSSGDLTGEEEARENVGDTLVVEGESYEVTLEEPGTYEYFCIPHEDHGMKGRIVVEE